MALPPTVATRQLRHRRAISVQVYSQGNGLWEVDAEISDVKTRDVPLGGAMRQAGDPIHDMLLRLIVDERLTIVKAGSLTRAMPYPGACNQYGTPTADPYEALAGLNLLKNFRTEVRERLSGVRGCTHLTELAQVLPSAVIQAFAGDVIDTRGEASSTTPPFQIDRCHALRSDGATVQLHYPRWYRPPTATARAEG